jgi:hypothetical protein
MHMSLPAVVVSTLLLLTWGILILRHSRRSRRARESWRKLTRSYPDLDRELDEIWQRLLTRAC